MQNIQTAQKAQNPQQQTIAVSRGLVCNSADSLWALYRISEAAETIALTIKELSQGNTLIAAQADLLLQINEEIQAHHSPQSYSYELWELVEEADAATSK